MWSLDGDHEAAAPLKPMLTPEEQVAVLKDKGITFKRCSEDEAIGALTERNTYLHLTSYRKLFQRNEWGMYIGLDFADLLELDELDAALRDAMLSAAYDVERLVKTNLVAKIAGEEGEDGYGIVADFIGSQEKKYRKAIERDLLIRMNAESEGDAYTGDLIRHYKEAMPIWVFLEVTTLGTMLAFYLFVSERYDDQAMRKEQYALRSVKCVRNCGSHGSCMLNEITSEAKEARELSDFVYEWMRENGIKNTKSRRAKLRNRKMQQFAETLAMFDRLGCSDTSPETVDKLRAVSAKLHDAEKRYGTQNAFVTYLGFLGDLIDIAV